MLKSNKNQGIQVLRGLAAVIVLFYHVLYQCFEYFNLNAHLLLTKFYLGSTGVGIFFVISGFVITLSFKKKFLLNRIIRIFPPYWIAIILSLYLFSDSKITMDSLFLIPRSAANYNYSYRIPQWTLIYEMFFYTLMYISILLNFTSERMNKLMFSWLLIIVTHNLIREVDYITPGFEIFFSPINVFFIFGVCIALNKEMYVQIPTYILLLVAVIGYQFLNITFLTLHYTIQSLVCSAIFLSFINLKNLPNILVKLGDASYGIYLVHFMIIVWIINLVKVHEVTVNLFQLCILAFIASLLAGTIYGYVESELHKKIANYIKRITRKMP